MGDRWFLKRALTGATLTNDAPLKIIEAPTRGLNGAGSMRFTLTGSIAARPSDVDGLPLIQEWNTRVYRVTDEGQVTWGGIVISSDDSATEWIVEAATDSTILFGTAYLGPVQRLAQVDPADIVRLIFHHVQGQPGGDLGIQIVGSTGLKVGSASSRDALEYERAYNDAVKTYKAAVAERKRLAAIVADSRKTYSGYVKQGVAANAELSAAKKVKPKATARIAAAQAEVNRIAALKSQQNGYIKDHQADVNAQQKVVAQASSEKKLAYERKVKANDRAREDGGAYELLWWEAPDCGELVQDLADDGPFDYVDEWAMSGDTITSTFHIYYPRAGRKRDDVVFEQGRNVVDVIEATVPGDDYASEVVGIGAGEGSGSVRRSTSTRTGRIRRVAVVTDKTVKTGAQMDRIINRELVVRQRVLEVQKLRVKRTAGTSWDLGDDVHVKVTLRGHGPIDLLHRIVEEQPDATDPRFVDLTLRRSDSFQYGG
ncbi:hypothetical protein [Curtobacterium sp. DN_7.5]|uniref:hypothetical protein n=1 Tax=Curtobacterium sp. DN_7.5 TaxID=3049047 RepID=UPI001F567E17|nr:hypothetical protein [Curtobacterium sp. DN_7.5]